MERKTAEEIEFGDGVIKIEKGQIWFDQYDWGMSGRKLKDVYDAYIKFNNNPFGESQETEILRKQLQQAEQDRLELSNKLRSRWIGELVTGMVKDGS